MSGAGAVSDDLGGRALPGRSEAVRAAVRAVVRDAIAPAAVTVDRESRFPSDSLDTLARAGLGGLLVGPALGGTGDSRLTWVVAVEELARARVSGCSWKR